MKTDAGGALLVAAVIWFVDRAVRTGQWRWHGGTAAALVGIVVSNSRAALVALVAVAAILLCLRDFRRLRPLVAFGAFGLLALSLGSLASGKPWEQGPVYRLYESVLSVTDIQGTRTYRAESLGDKADNNDFRLTWWNTVIDETTRHSPVFGLGFGHDLANEFTRRYYAVADDDFTARSPHNFLLSIYGRLGAVGLLIFTGIGVSVAIGTWRTGRSAAKAEPDGGALPYWLGAWGIFFSACFGVVLEGPMGAVLFWTLLGTAHARSHLAGQIEEIPYRTAPEESGDEPWHAALNPPNQKPAHGP